MQLDNTKHTDIAPLSPSHWYCNKGPGKKVRLGEIVFTQNFLTLSTQLMALHSWDRLIGFFGSKLNSNYNIRQFRVCKHISPCEPTLSGRGGRWANTCAGRRSNTTDNQQRTASDSKKQSRTVLDRGPHILGRNSGCFYRFFGAANLPHVAFGSSTFVGKKFKMAARNGSVKRSSCGFLWQVSASGNMANIENSV